jgi:probable HAF family extracellular repeat protein
MLWTGGARIDLGTLAGEHSSGAAAINDAGQIVGTASVTSGGTTYSLAVRWDGGAIRELGTLGGAASNATAINAAGFVVGSAQTTGGNSHAVLWRAGVIADLGTLDGTSSLATSINRDGLIVGAIEYASDPGHPRAFIGTAGPTPCIQHLSDLLDPGSGWTLISANAINDAGQIVGTGVVGTESHGYLLNPL